MTDDHREPGGLHSLRGDLDLLVFVFGELRRSYAELPGRWLCDLTLPRVLALLSSTTAKPDRPSDVARGIGEIAQLHQAIDRVSDRFNQVGPSLHSAGAGQPGRIFGSSSSPRRIAIGQNWASAFCLIDPGLLGRHDGYWPGAGCAEEALLSPGLETGRVLSLSGSVQYDANAKEGGTSSFFPKYRRDETKAAAIACRRRRDAAGRKSRNRTEALEMSIVPAGYVRPETEQTAPRAWIMGGFTEPAADRADGPRTLPRG